MREEIISLGGEVLFNTKVVDFEINTNQQMLEAVATEDGNSIKEKETKQIAFGAESVVSYAISYKNIEGGTNLFPASISGYKIDSFKIKTYYNNHIRDNGAQDEGASGGMDENSRIAIISPKSSDIYIVENKNKKLDTTNIIENNNLEDDTKDIIGEENKQNEIVAEQESEEKNKQKIEEKEEEKINYSNTINENKDIDNNESLNSSVQKSQKLPNTGINDIFVIIFIPLIVVLVISIIKYVQYRNIN